MRFAVSLQVLSDADPGNPRMNARLTIIDTYDMNLFLLKLVLIFNELPYLLDAKLLRMCTRLKLS